MNIQYKLTLHVLHRKYSNATKARRTVETPNMHKHSNDAVDTNENEAHSPCKNLEEQPICSPQKISISRTCEACKTKLGCVLEVLNSFRKSEALMNWA